MCGPLSGLSGGDVHALRLLWHWNQREPGRVVLLAPEGVRAASPVDIPPESLMPVRTPLDRWLRGLISYTAVVIGRTVVASATAPPARFAVTASHFFHDVVPAALHKLRFGSTPVVYVHHLVGDKTRTPSVRTWLSLAGERFSVALMRLSRAVVFVIDDQARESLARLGIQRERLLMTDNAYDPLFSLPDVSRSEIPSVVFMGRFTAEKGIWDMITLARALQDAAPKAQLTMLGDGPLRGELLDRVARERLENIDAPGFVDEETKWRRLRGATLFVAPSREEGWGIAVGEALRAGLPVVAYDLPAYSHLGNLPLYVPVGDSDRLISTVVDLLRDPARLAGERDRVRSQSETLPTWSELLDAELDALARV